MIALEQLPYIYTLLIFFLLNIIYYIFYKIYKYKYNIIFVFILSIILLFSNLFLQKNSKDQTKIRFEFLLENIYNYKMLYGKFPDNLSYLNDVNEDYYSWCSKKSDDKIPGRGLCYYTIKDDEFILEVVGHYNDWYYNSFSQQKIENNFDRHGL